MKDKLLVQTTTPATLDIERWLQAVGLKFKPFQHVKAERDPHLFDYFVNFPYFDEIRSIEAGTTFLFTERGCGKSANRRMLEYICEEALESKTEGTTRILGVSYTDFSAILEDQPQNITLSRHVEEILKCATPALFDAMVQHLPTAIETLGEDEKDDLIWFFRRYSDCLTQRGVNRQLREIGVSGLDTEAIWEAAKGGLSALIALVKGSPAEAAVKSLSALAQLATRDTTKKDLEGMKLTPIKLTERFVALTRRLGIDAVYIIVNRIDELSQTAGKIESMVELLEPIVTSIPLLETVDFKFFLPSELNRAFLRHLGTDRYRIDRFPPKEVKWDEEDLREVLVRRLEAASDDKRRISSFVDLVLPSDSRLDIDAQLVKYAYHSPRDLVRIGKRILSEHCKMPTTEVFISEEEVVEAIRQFSEKRAEELYGLDDLTKLTQIGGESFTLKQAKQRLGTPIQETERLIDQWLEKGLIRGTPEIVSKKRDAVFDIPDPRVRLLLSESNNL